MLPHLLLAAALLAPADTTHLVLVATTDVHGRAYGWDYVADRPFAGGLARVATVVDSLRARYPGRVIMVDAGDLIQGDPFAGYFARVAPRDTNPVIAAMNLVGYDAATLGNHEFNWGLGALDSALARAAFPYVSANITDAGNRLRYPAQVVLDRAGVRVGITGFTTPGVMVWDRENVRGRVRVHPVEPRAGPALERLRRDADITIALIHAGMDGESSYDTAGIGPENVAARLAALRHRPDVVVVGHSHRAMADSVINGVHFIQAENWAQGVAVLHLTLVRRGARWTLAAARGELVPLDDVRPDPRVTTALRSAHDSARAWVTAPLAVADAAMPAALARTGPTPIINFIHAVQRRVTGAQLSAASAFNLGGGIPAGAVRLADVASIYPYENTLRAVRIAGADLRAFLERSAEYYQVEQGQVRIDPEMPGYNFDMIGGAEYVLDLSRPVGSRVTSLRVDGRDVAPTDSFTLAVNSYRQGGGGGYTMLADAPVVYDKGENIRDLLADALAAVDTIRAADYDARNWRIVPDTLAAQLPALQQVPSSGRSPYAPPGNVALRILATTDFHGAITPEAASWAGGRLAGGAAVLGAMIDSATVACDCPVLHLDGGDQMQGTLVSNLDHGRGTVAGFNAMGLDAAVVGNHDLDWGVDTLRARMREARYPWLAANVYDSAVGGRPDWARPYAILEAGGRRVAVIGYMTPETKSIVMARHVAGLAFPGGAAALRGVLDTVAAEQPDLTIIVAHAGAVCDTTSCRGEILQLARSLPAGAVDAIVAGHTHRPVDITEAGIPVIQARANATSLGILDLVVEGDSTRWDGTLLDVLADGVTQDAEVAATVAPWEAQVDSLMRVRVATLRDTLRAPRSGATDVGLGNLIADAQREESGAEVAMMNNGGIRSDLDAGIVTYGDLFALQPFGNRMVVATVPGRVVRAALEHIVAGREPDAHVSGITVTYDPARPRGRRVVAARVAGRGTLDDRATYRVALNDFMANGGSGFTMFTGQPREDVGATDLDVLVRWLEARPQPVVADPAPRITAAP